MAEREQATVTVPAKELGRVLHNAALFASRDETRPVLTCVSFTFGSDRLTVRATDSYMLGRFLSPRPSRSRRTNPRP